MTDWLRADPSDPYVACAVGNVDGVSRAVAADPGWANRPGGPLGQPPLATVMQSSLVRLPEFAPGLRECARVLLDAGANPDDDESLYHSLGDHDDAEVLRLLLDHGGDPNEPSPSLATPLLHAIRRRCSTAFVRLLLDAGADPAAVGPDGVDAYRKALRFGLTEAAGMIRDLGGGVAERLDARELLIADCAKGKGAAVRNLLAAHPDLVATLDHGQRRLLPDLAAAGAADAVRLMVEAGWPIDTPGGDWHATALDHAVFRGDAALTRFLLEHGADPAVRHGFGDTVVGTLSWASLNNEEKGIVADWAGCARALRDHGVVLPEDYEFGDGVR